MTASLRNAVLLAIAAHEGELVRRFGFADLAVDVALDETARVVSLRGRVLARRFAARVVAAVEPIVPTGWRIDATGLATPTDAPWHALAIDPAALRTAIFGDGRTSALATELHASDGPVQRLAEHAGFHLVRARDGTLGWTDAALGERVDAPALGGPTHTDPHAFVAAIRTWLGTPYRLGGTTRAGIDCSGLVQRALTDATGMLVPRHSSDQLAIDPREGAGNDAPGDLLFVWTSAEAPCHVGVADGAGAVLHASRRRGVVSDARAHVLAGASRTRHVPWRSIVDLQARARGAEALDDVLALGRPLP